VDDKEQMRLAVAATSRQSLRHQIGEHTDAEEASQTEGEAAGAAPADARPSELVAG